MLLIFSLFCQLVNSHIQRLLVISYFFFPPTRKSATVCCVTNVASLVGFFSWTLGINTYVLFINVKVYFIIPLKRCLSWDRCFCTGVSELTCLWALTDTWQQTETGCLKWLLLSPCLSRLSFVMLHQAGVTELVYECLRHPSSQKWQQLPEKGRRLGGEMRNERTNSLKILDNFKIFFWAM